MGSFDVCKCESNESISSRCSCCQNLLRKIEELELTLAGRDIILTALQNQLMRCENNYKKLFGDHENLRLKHSFALQDNSSLKEINAKLEEFSTVSNEPFINEPLMSSSVIPDNSRLEESPHGPVHFEINHIETLVQAQNQILKELIEKIVHELKFVRSEKCICVQSIGAEESFKQIESGDHLDANVKIQKLADEIEKLKSLVETRQKENEIIKQFLLNRKKRLSCCTKTAIDINSSVTDKKDQEMSTEDVTCDTSCSNHEKILELQMEIQEKDKQFEHCSCQLIEELNDMHDNNHVLSDTLEVVTAENKNNLDIITKLKAEIDSANQDCEKTTEALKSRILELENELEDIQISEKKLRKSIDSTENNAKNLKDRLKNVIEENVMLQERTSVEEKESKTKLANLGAENAELKKNLEEKNLELAELKKDLTEKNLELVEYEEENRDFCQRLEAVTNYNNEMTNTVRELRAQLSEKPEEVDKSDVGSQKSNTEHTQLKEQLIELHKENKCLTEKCKTIKQLGATDAENQLKTLKASIKDQLGEIEQLEIENDILKAEIERLKNENKAETERLQGMVNHSQRQVEMLLKEHDEKTSQIENVANELDNIRKSVTDDTDNFLDQIKQLQKERDELKELVSEHQKCKKCSCDLEATEINRLNADILKKQCIIAELEESVDNFNETLKNVDKTMESLTCENADLKSENDKRARELEALQAILADKINELEKIRNQPERSELLGQKYVKEDMLEVKQGNKISPCQAARRISDGLKLENQILKIDQEQILVENHQRRSQPGSLKANNTKRRSTVSGQLEDLQKAYDELQRLFDKRSVENEQLRNDNMLSSKCSEKTQKACNSLRVENEKLREQTSIISEEVKTLREECKKLKNDCAIKCIESECLKDTADKQRHEKILYEKDCQELKQKQEINEQQLSELRNKLDELRNSYEQKSEELQKIKKKWESCAKQSQITREEYNNLRKEYKEIKTMLADQINKFKQDTGGTDTHQPCQVVEDLKKRVLDKENQITMLQEKLKEAAYEIIELKDYIHKLIGDNTILKSAINNLITNLERKIKGPSFGSLPTDSVEGIAGDILHSLTTIEDIIMKNGDTCPKGCHGKNCDCMSEISSQYKLEVAQQGPSNCNKNTKYYSDPQIKKMQQTDSSGTGIALNIPPESLFKSVSEPGVASENNTTDSDEPSSGLDQKSLEFFKDAIHELKTTMDCTMKEKSCDCEQRVVKDENAKK